MSLLAEALARLQQVGNPEYASMPHSDLYQMRYQQPTKQNEIAPYEHRAFAREWTQENPLLASVSLPFAIPGYTAYKAMGFGNTRSQPSMDQIKQGYTGLAEGLLSLMK
jgi:hypothetical protein